MTNNDDKITDLSDDLDAVSLPTLLVALVDHFGISAVEVVQMPLWNDIIDLSQSNYLLAEANMKEVAPLLDEDLEAAHDEEIERNAADAERNAGA